MDEGDPPTVAEFAEYCRVQAGLLSGCVETMGEEADALLDEIDADIADARSSLDAGRDTPGGPAGPDTAASAGGPDLDDGTIADLEEKQALVEATQARMRAFQSLSAAYAELAETLATDVETPSEALDRVVGLEVDRNAPAYFEDRETLCERVGSTTGDG